MTNSNDIGPDSPILHYLRNIEAKLDRLNERLDKFLSARKKREAHAQAMQTIPRALKFSAREKRPKST